MRIIQGSPQSLSEAASTEQRRFCFTVPHAQEAATTPAIAEDKPGPGWHGITAGWLAAADSAA